MISSAVMLKQINMYSLRPKILIIKMDKKRCERFTVKEEEEMQRARASADAAVTKLQQ